MIVIDGIFYVNIIFGESEISIPNENISELSITTDINKIVPSAKLSFEDSTGSFGHLSPFDNNMNKMTIELSRGNIAEPELSYRFSVYRRFITNDNTYTVIGLLDINDLFVDLDPFCYSGNLIESLETIASKYLNISTSEIGSSLDYDKKIINPGWSITNFINYLKATLIGKASEASYFGYVNKDKFVFKSLNELVIANATKKYIVNEKSFHDYSAAFEYNIFDNSMLLSKFNTYGKKNFYFDFDAGEVAEKTSDITSFPSMCQFNLVTKDRQILDTKYINRGRSNDYETDFSGRLNNSIYSANVNLIKKWLTINGDISISAGDTVEVVFGQAFAGGELDRYQHQGYWLVERIIHIIGRTFNTRLLLTRNGINTDVNNQLYEYNNYKRN